MLSRLQHAIRGRQTSFFRQQLNTWLATLEVSAERVLDAGGGANPVKNRVRSWHVRDYVILDNCLENQRTEPRIIADLNRGLSTENSPTAMGECGSFNVVFCLEVMEYIWNPVVALENLNLFLREGGRLYITFPFVYPIHDPVGYDFLRYTQEGAQKLLTETGFQVNDIFIRRIHDEKLLAAAYNADRMHGREDNTAGHTGYCVTATKSKG